MADYTREGFSYGMKEQKVGNPTESLDSVPALVVLGDYELSALKDAAVEARHKWERSKERVGENEETLNHSILQMRKAKDKYDALSKYA